MVNEWTRQEFSQLTEKELKSYELWLVRLEERYIRQCGPEKGCQLVIDTTEFFP